MPLWRCSLVFRDRDENERTASLCTSAATTVAALVGFAAGLESALQPLSSAQIVSATINTTWRYESALAPVGSDVRRKLLFLARQSTPERYASFVVPSPDYAILQPLRCGLRYVEKAEASPALTNAVTALLATGMVTPYLVPFPTEAWALAGMSDE